MDAFRVLVCDPISDSGLDKLRKGGLDEIRQADALIHVVDASGSSDEEGQSCPPGSHDPVSDLEFVEREFDAWIFGILQKDWPYIARSAESGNRKLTPALAEKLSALCIREMR